MKVKHLEKGMLFHLGNHKDSDRYDYIVRRVHSVTTEMETFGEGNGIIVWSDNKQQSTTLTIYADDAEVHLVNEVEEMRIRSTLQAVQAGEISVDREKLKRLVHAVQWFNE